MTSAKILVLAEDWPMWLPASRIGFLIWVSGIALFHGFPAVGNNILWGSCAIANLRRPFVRAGVVGMRRIPGLLHVNRRYFPTARWFLNFYADFRQAIWRFTVSVPHFDVKDLTMKWTNLVAGAGKVRCAAGVASRSIIPIRKFEDNLCAQRALVLLMVRKKKQTDSNPEIEALWRLLRNTENKSPESKACRTLKTLSLELSQEAGVDPTSPTDFADLHRLQHAITTKMGVPSHIQVFSGVMHMDLLFSTLPEGEIQPNFDEIHWYDLILKDEHYVPVTKIHRVIHNQRKFCYKCKTTYHSNHVCKHGCSMCHGDVDHFKLWQETNDGSQWQFCVDCGRNFFGDECFSRHKTQGVCDKIWKCVECKQVFQRRKPDQDITGSRVNPEEHTCHTFWCKNCKSWQHRDHKCYMTVTKPKKSPGLFLFADFESTQETGTHKVNLAVTQDHNGVSWPVFPNIKSWVSHLLNGDFWGYTVVFHNGKGYDFHFILKEILRRKGFKYKVDPIMVGAKILYFTISQKTRFTPKSGIRFVDSLNFLPMPLKKFTKTFGLTTKKGFYPHFFNTPSNESYVGPIPSKEMFGASTMDARTFDEFSAWYEERKQEVWNNYKELVDYCVADVDLLRQGCLAFRSLVMESTESGHDPFQHITLASSAMGLFRSEMLRPQTVGAFSSRLARELKPCLAGGRTGATKLYDRAENGERIFYVDFTSAYPYVCKNGVYPKGHPIEWTPTSSTPKPSLSSGASIWCVDITCPQDLYHPLLHSKDPNTGLLLFDLRDKSEVMYTNFELQEALTLGYTITHVYKVFYWPETITGVFKDYINIFLKMKQQSGGWPSENMTDSEKKTYIDEYKLNEGIDLDASQIGKNSGKYHVAKLYLNSLWGKFGQRLGEHFPSTMLLHDTSQGVRAFNQACARDNLKDVLIVSEHSLVVTCEGRRVEDHVCCGGTNIALAIFTTAWARLKLYREILKPLGRRVCYYDTDSAIFKIHETEMEWLHNTVPLGKYLGDVTNELGNKYTYEGPYITEFVSGGPKNYGYRTTTNEKVSKIKGHSLKKRNIAQFLNFESIKDAVLNSTEFLVDNKQITREDGFVLRNRQGSKIYRLNFLKRRVLNRRFSQHDGLLTTIDTKPWDQKFSPPERSAEMTVSDFVSYQAVSDDFDLTVRRPAKRVRRETACLVLNSDLAIEVFDQPTFPNDTKKHILRIEGFTSKTNASRFLAAGFQYYHRSNLSPTENTVVQCLFPLITPLWSSHTVKLTVFTNLIEMRELIQEYSGETRIVFVQ